MMRYILTIIASTLMTVFVSAQSNNNGKKAKDTSTARSSRAGKLPKGTKMAGGKVVPVHNGPHNYTPGSPVGTGGAGGGSLGGSPQGSASKNAMGEVPADELLEEKNAAKGTEHAGEASGNEDGKIKKQGKGTKKGSGSRKRKQGSGSGNG